MAINMTLKETQARILAMVGITTEMSIISFYKALFYAVSDNNELRDLLSNEFKRHLT